MKLIPNFRTVTVIAASVALAAMFCRAQDEVCGDYRTGCIWLPDNCGGFFAGLWGTMKVAGWTCTSNNVANNYTCDQSMAGCCTVPYNPECPPPNCPCPTAG
jgi:hypothetical protein